MANRAQMVPRARQTIASTIHALGVAEDIRGRIGFVVFAVGVISTATVVLANQVGAIVTAVVLVLLLISLAGGVVALHSAQRHERRAAERRATEVAEQHSATLAARDAEHTRDLEAQRQRVADARELADTRLEDLRRQHQHELQAHADQAADRIRQQLERDNQLASAHGTLVPRFWSAIITGQPDGRAPEVDYVPPGYTVRMSSDTVSDELGNHASAGGRVINGRRSSAVAGRVGGPDPSVPVNYDPRDL